jgi:hypothetical protein
LFCKRDRRVESVTIELQFADNLSAHIRAKNQDLSKYNPFGTADGRLLSIVERRNWLYENIDVKTRKQA